MKADQLGSLFDNFLVSLGYTALVWYAFNPPPVVLFFFFIWIANARSTKSRLREINTREKLNSCMIAELLEKQNPSFKLDDALEDFGLKEYDD